MATRSCETCTYGHQAEPARHAPGTDPGTGRAFVDPAVWECRRHPPVPSTKGRTAHFESRRRGAGEYRPRGVFPEVNADDWCGHHTHGADDPEDRGR